MSVRSILCIALATSYIGAAANAQTPHYRGAAVTGDSVTVDLSVLDRLGPPPSLPQLLRPGSVTPQTLAPPSAQPEADATARLQEPPSGAPKSSLNVPSPGAGIEPPRRPARQPAAVRTPPPTAQKPPPRVVQKPAPRAAEPTPAPKQAPAPVAKTAPAPAPRAAAPAPKAAAPAPKAAAPAPKAPAAAKPPARQQAAAAPAPPKRLEPAKPAAPRPSAAPAKPAAPKQPEQAARPAATAAIKPAPAETKAPAPAPAPKEEAKPAPARQVAAVPGEAIERDDGLTVTFAPGSSDLPDNAVGALDRLAERLKSDPNMRIQLVGFARTQVESASQARRLSLFRALSVRTHLMKKGVRSTRMDVRALGNKEDDGPPDRVDLVVPSGS